MAIFIHWISNAKSPDGIVVVVIVMLYISLLLMFSCSMKWRGSLLCRCQPRFAQFGGRRIVTCNI